MEFVERPGHFFRYTVMDEGSGKIAGHSNTLDEAKEIAAKHTAPAFVPHIYENLGLMERR